jgi:hypothetical protein
MLAHLSNHSAKSHPLHDDDNDDDDEDNAADDDNDDEDDDTDALANLKVKTAL